MKQLKILRVALVLVVAALFTSAIAFPQSTGLVAVISRPVSRTVDLPGEFQPYRSVEIHAKIRGYLDRVLVDRGSTVKRGQLLAQLSAPEMQAQIVVAEARVRATESDRAQAESQLAALQSTSGRLKKAAETPGAIAGNELIQAQSQVDAAQALVQSKKQATAAAQAEVRAQKDLEGYLRVTAPFDGMVTERLLHPGALVGTASDPVLLVIQEISRLRLVVAVPETDVAGIVSGGKVEFHVPAYPNRAYSGTVARSSHSIDPKTRTMAVELDVFNRDGSLSPGMYPSVKWPVRGARASLLVPKTSVVTTTERTFVIRNRGGRAEWVNVAKGALDGDLTEVSGPLQPGDMIVKRATDELRDGSAISPPRKAP